MLLDDPDHRERIRFLKDFLKDKGPLINRLRHVCKLILTGEYEEPESIARNKKRYCHHFVFQLVVLGLLMLCRI